MTKATLRLLRVCACIGLLFLVACGDGGKAGNPQDGGADGGGDNDGGIDLSCVRMRALRSWSAEPSAIAMLFTVETCDDGTPVRGLTPEEFTISEDDMKLSSEADPDFVPSRGRRVYITLLLDMSSSTRPVVDQLISGAKTFVNELLVERQLNVAIGIEVFDGAPTTVAWQLPIQDAGRLSARLEALSDYVGPDPSSTNLNGAIVSAVSSLQVRQQNVITQNDQGVVTQGYLVMFTDGFDTSDTTTEQSAIDAISGARGVTLSEGSLPPVESYAVALAGEDYSPEKLLALFSGSSTSSPTTQCANSCYSASNGTCEDGGPGSYGASCSYGSDCDDCGTRGVQQPSSDTCSNSCQWSSNGTCDDGGPDAYSSNCSYGTDCGDCGPRGQQQSESSCSNSCSYAYDGVCEDGLPGSSSFLCDPGSDCSDCGPRLIPKSLPPGQNAQVGFGTTEEARRHVLEAQNPEELEKRFNDLAAKIALQLEGTYLLAYCSPKRSGTHTLTLNVKGSVSENGSPLTYTFSAAGFDPGCTAELFTSSCDEKGCGGFNCGACDDETEVCDGATDQCESACLGQGLCSGQSFTNLLGYEQTCNLGDQVTQCGSQCVDTQTNEMHCGSCNDPCGLGSSCVAGNCACPSAAQTACANGCFDLKEDEQNCGTCGNYCPSGVSCTNGVCDCGGGIIGCSGSCIDPKTSQAHCGACGNQCPYDATCNSGSCVCGSLGLSVCPGVNNCVDKASDELNCGECGKSCGPSGSCVSGSCQCGEGYELCGGTCADTLNDAARCGSCTNACASNQLCQAGSCVANPLAACTSTVLSGPSVKASGTFVGASTAGSGNCYESGMKRVSFAYTVPSTGYYYFSVEGASGVELSTACSGGYLTCGYGSSQANLTAGNQVVVTVFASSEQTGAFSLFIESDLP